MELMFSKLPFFNRFFSEVLKLSTIHQKNKFFMNRNSNSFEQIIFYFFRVKSNHPPFLYETC